MSRLNSPGYQIGQSSGVCASTGRRLEVGEQFVAALVEPDGTDELARLDFSLIAWEEGSRPAPPTRLFGFWKGVVVLPSSRPQTLIDDDGLIDLFEQLAEQTDPRRLAFRFVLALILVRKRLLVVEESRPGMMLVRLRGTARPPEGPAYIPVADPGLDDDAIDGVIEQLEAVMPGVTLPGGQESGA